MADNNLTGVTTRALTTAQDAQRASAISERSRLATEYTAQFRTDRNQLRRGGVVRTTGGPGVPAAQGDVTQTQDVSVPGSFQDVIDAAGGIQGGRQGANQTVNPGLGGGSGGGGSVSGGSGSGSDDTNRSSTPAGDPGNWVWTDNNGDVVDAPTDTTMSDTPKSYKDYPPGSSERQAALEAKGYRVESSDRADGGKNYRIYSPSGRLWSNFAVQKDGKQGTSYTWLQTSPTQGYNMLFR